MSDEKLIRFVIRQMDASVLNISQDQQENLKRARFAALQHGLVRETRFANTSGLFHLGLITRRAIMRVLALLILTLGMAYWHANHYIIELEELDSAILTDEMPMDVITDKGFDTWLRSSNTH